MIFSDSAFRRSFDAARVEKRNSFTIHVRPENEEIDTINLSSDDELCICL